MNLTPIWVLPLVGALLVAFMPPRWSKWMSVATAIVTLGFAVIMAFLFDPTARGYQFSEQLDWIPQFRIFYHLGVDGISIWLVVLNALLTVIAVLATPLSMKN